MSDDVITIDERTNLIVPKPKNAGAALIIEKFNSIRSRLAIGVAEQQMFHAIVTEVNALGKPCTAGSIAKAAFNTAVLGLIPGSALGHAYFVPFWNGKIVNPDGSKGANECVLVVGYRGFLHLAFSTKFLVDVYSDVVLAGEEWEYAMTDEGPRLRHVPGDNRKMVKPEVLRSYCVYHTARGGRGVVVCSRSQLDKVDTGKNVWQSDYCSQAMKTPLRRASKFWQLTPGLAQAVQLDEEAERIQTGDEKTTQADFGGAGADVGSPEEEHFSLLGDESNEQADE